MSPRGNPIRSAIAVGFGITALLGVSACGDDADAAIDDGVVTVTLRDFSFSDLPDEVPAGTRLQIRNEAERELHELVAVRLDDDDDRPVDVVVHDLEALFGAGPPAVVLLAAPGGEQLAAVGDGTLTEPGRYLVVCSIPTGVDPEAFLAAGENGDGPPEVGGGPPHLEHGMFAELVVTDS